MLRTSLFVSAVVLVAALLAAGGAAAQETADAERVETTTAQQTVVEAEVIVEDRSGTRLSNIRVTAEWGDGESDSATTSSAGRALLDVPNNANVEFFVNDTANQFVRNHQPVTVGPANIDDAVTIQMAQWGQTEFTVVDAEDEPVPEATLRLFHEGDTRLVDLVTTGEDGTVSVSGIEQRSYDVAISRAGFNRSDQTIEVADGGAETFEIERHRVNVDFTVRDDHFEEPRPLEDATVDIESVGSPLPTDESGETQARIPVNDNYRVTVLLEGYREATRTLRLSQRPTSLEITTQRTRSISINQLQNAIVVGQPTQVTITNAYAEPVEGATVLLNDETVGQTDAQGQIVFNISQAGDNTIEAKSRGLTASTTLQGVDPDAGGSEDTDGSDGGTEEQTDSTDESDDETDASTSEDGADDGDSADAIGPGFGVAAALVALLGVGLLTRRSS